MKILKSILDTLRTTFVLVTCYSTAYFVYSALAFMQIELPTLQELLSANAVEWLKTPQNHALSDSAKICELVALGYQVTSADGALELCINKGAK